MRRLRYLLSQIREPTQSGLVDTSGLLTHFEFYVWWFSTQEKKEASHQLWIFIVNVFTSCSVFHDSSVLVYLSCCGGSVWHCRSGKRQLKTWGKCYVYACVTTEPNKQTWISHLIFNLIVGRYWTQTSKHMSVQSLYLVIPTGFACVRQKYLLW